jgi:chromosome segregation ATPase
MSSTIEQIKERVDALSQRYKKVSEKKANLSGLLQAKKEELKALVEEIQAAGLDPKKLKEHRDSLQSEVEKQLGDLETKVSAVEEALNAYDANNK